jgi:peptidoglycan hydrolase CwlO-like protein
LEKWYALQDNAESKALGLTAAEKTLAALQAQVDAALAQLMTVTKRIQEIAAENETLRGEITALRRQLVHLLGPQPA